MNSQFTIHCIAWQAGAPLLQNLRAAASKMGLIDQAEALSDQLDEQCRHALALSTGGQAIGCARITLDGRIERMVVLPHEHRAQIEAALSEVLHDYANQIKPENPRVAKKKASRSQAI